MKVLDEAKTEFPQECSKENITVEKVIFFSYVQKQNISAQKHFFYFVVLGFKAETFLLNITKHVKLNSLAMIFICVQFNKRLLRFFFTDKINLKNSFAKMLVVECFYNP